MNVKAPSETRAALLCQLRGAGAIACTGNPYTATLADCARVFRQDRRGEWEFQCVPSLWPDWKHWPGALPRSIKPF